jgi:hypothetical protein
MPEGVEHEERGIMEGYQGKKVLTDIFTRRSGELQVHIQMIDGSWGYMIWCNRVCVGEKHPEWDAAEAVSRADAWLRRD